MEVECIYMPRSRRTDHMHRMRMRNAREPHIYSARNLNVFYQAIASNQSSARMRSVCVCVCVRY